MSASFTCPYCGLVSEIDPAHVGKSGPCRGCGKEVTVPFPKEASLPPTASSRGSSTPWIVGCAVFAVIGVVILGLAVCGGLTFFSLRSSQQMQQELMRAEQAERFAVEAQAEAKKATEEAASELEKAAAELEKKTNEAPPP